MNLNEGLSFEEWSDLPYSAKREIWNNQWDPFEPEIGSKSKRIIVEEFAKKLKIDFEQIGIASFGWQVYMLFVIVTDSKIRVPKKFADLPVNKGVITESISDKKVMVKFDYGGKTEVDLKEKIIIK